MKFKLFIFLLLISQNFLFGSNVPLAPDLIELSKTFIYLFKVAGVVIFVFVAFDILEGMNKNDVGTNLAIKVISKLIAAGLFFNAKSIASMFGLDTYIK